MITPDTATDPQGRTDGRSLAAIDSTEAPDVNHRSVALLSLAAFAAILAGPEAARRAGIGDWGGAAGTLVAPFLVFVLANLVVYVLARLLRAPDRVASFRRTRLNYAGLVVAVLVLVATAARRGTAG